MTWFAQDTSCDAKVKHVFHTHTHTAIREEGSTGAAVKGTEAQHKANS